MAEIGDLAEGKWRDILVALGLDRSYLTGKHGPCPMCSGKDRWRFTDYQNRGGWYCNACGSGDGFAFLSAWKEWDFRTAAKEVRGVIGECSYAPPKPKVTRQNQLANCQGLLRCSDFVRKSDPVDLYLTSRGVGMDRYPDSLRTCMRAVYYTPDEGRIVLPAMLAIVSAPDGSMATLHRTFLKPDGSGKADVASPRLLMPGQLPKGSAVRLAAKDGAEEMGVAEGIETALAASRLHGHIPVWATLNTSGMKHFAPPPRVRRLHIFMDRDAKFGGEAAGYTLAHKAACSGVEVVTHAPDCVGTDYNDVLVKGMPGGEVCGAI